MMTNYFIVRMLLFTVFYFSVHGSRGQSVVVLGNEHEDLVVNRFAYVYKGNASPYSFDTLVRADTTSFTRNPSNLEVNYGFHQQRGWCKFHIRNASEQQNWILMVQQSRVDTVQLYILREGQAPESFAPTGHFQAIPDRPVHSLPFAFPVSLKKNETITCYLYTQRQYGRHAAILNIQTKSYFENYQHAFIVSIGFISGMIILAALVGFVLFLFVRERMYIYYSIYAISFFFLLMVDTGFAHGVLSFPRYQTVVNGFTFICYYWIGGWHLLFTIELLQIRKYHHRWVYWSGLLASYFFCLASIVLFIPSLPESVRFLLVMVCYYILFPGNAYILYAVSVSILKKEPIVYLYMAGFFVTLIVGTLLTLSDFEILNIPNMNKDFYYLTPLVEVLCMVMGFGIQFSKTIKERYNVQFKLSQTQDQIITIQEDERRRIAQDLHDDVGNSLAAVRNMVVQKKEPVEVEKEITNVISTIRTISHNLMPVDFNEFSLVDIIRHLVNKFKDNPSIILEFGHSGKAVKIRSLTELVIYRIINELITNIFKHSKATKAFIQLMYQPEGLVITVEDNGVGIKSKGRAEEGIGMKSIRLRAAYIHASINVESDDKGTLIILEIPYGNS